MPSVNDQVRDYRITALVGFQADVVVDRVAKPRNQPRSSRCARLMA
jgi:hypothetical protein